jgi:S-adenosylmethionine:tRNA ribosyltransferase-isomerase
VSGAHEPGSSHYELLRAFADRATLARVTTALEARQYRTHEFGDSVWIERRKDDLPHTKVSAPCYCGQYAMC